MDVQHPSRSANSPATTYSLVRTAGLVGLLAVGLFALGLGDGAFVDEYAYITQSYYADLLFSGRTNDSAWLGIPALDLVPLPKYLIGLSLRMAQIRRPGPEAARAWYRNTSSRWGPPGTLVVARLPSIIMGAICCIAIFAIGSIVRGGWVGSIAAFLLALNPLFRLHAHRAMSEAPCEAFLLLSLAIGLWGWRAILLCRSGTAGWLAPILAGSAAGLSVLAKLTGISALMCLAGWASLGIMLPGTGQIRRLEMGAGTIVAILGAWYVFLALNPFMTAHPAGPLPVDLKRMADLGTWQRLRLLVEHRRDVSRGQQEQFSHNALHTLSERATVVVVQGFGRFGPLGPSKSDSTRRCDLSQDWGAVLWLPLVLVGLISSIVLGRRQIRHGTPPTAWALVVWAGLALAVVTAYLPMAWDRYLLPIQAPFAMLAAVALGGIWETLSPRLFRLHLRP
jgi:4-amino-4-deoxy-L-arabinose transferase-like glycosyltransferase